MVATGRPCGRAQCVPDGGSHGPGPGSALLRFGLCGSVVLVIGGSLPRRPQDFGSLFPATVWELGPGRGLGVCRPPPPAPEAPARGLLRPEVPAPRPQAASGVQLPCPPCDFWALERAGALPTTLGALRGSLTTPPTPHRLSVGVGVSQQHQGGPRGTSQTPPSPGPPPGPLRLPWASPAPSESRGPCCFLSCREPPFQVESSCAATRKPAAPGVPPPCAHAHGEPHPPRAPPTPPRLRSPEDFAQRTLPGPTEGTQRRRRCPALCVRRRAACLSLGFQRPYSASLPTHGRRWAGPRLSAWGSVPQSPVRSSSACHPRGFRAAPPPACCPGHPLCGRDLSVTTAGESSAPLLLGDSGFWSRSSSPS